MYYMIDSGKKSDIFDTQHSKIVMELRLNKFIAKCADVCWNSYRF